MKSPKKNLAAIDIGTNSFHLVIAEVDVETGRFKILGKEKEVVRLGSGSTDMKYLSEPAMNRGIEVLKRFRIVADAFHADVRAIATLYARRSTNRILSAARREKPGFVWKLSPVSKKHD